MLVLAVDTTALTASAAVVAFENGVPDRYSLITVKNRLTHSENLMPMVEKALSAMEASINDIGLIAVWSVVVNKVLLVNFLRICHKLRRSAYA